MSEIPWTTVADHKANATLENLTRWGGDFHWRFKVSSVTDPLGYEYFYTGAQNLQICHDQQTIQTDYNTPDPMEFILDGTTDPFFNPGNPALLAPDINTIPLCGVDLGEVFISDTVLTPHATITNVE